MDSGFREKYTQARAAMDRAKVLDNMLTLLIKDKNALKTKVQRLEDEHQGEKLDVKKLERLGPTAILSLLRGKHAEDLDKERAEALTAYLSLEHAKKELADVNAQIEATLLERARLMESEREYYLLSERIKQQMLTEHGVASQAMAELEIRIVEARSRLNSLEDTASAGAQVLACLGKVQQNLLKAEALTVNEAVISGGLEKYDYIDCAREQASKAQRLMKRFYAEVAVMNMDSPLIDIAPSTQYLDYYLNCLITDVIVLGKIRTSLVRVKDEINRMSSVLIGLNAKIVVEKELIRSLTAEQQALVDRENEPC